jgi:RNA polymerase sigma-70 factor (ECF subfamily)
VELANLATPTLGEVIRQAHQGVERVCRTPHLAYSFLRPRRPVGLMTHQPHTKNSEESARLGGGVSVRAGKGVISPRAMYVGAEGTGVEDFATFYGRVRDPVYRVVVCVTGDRDQAEEAVAEAFARAYARWDRLGHHPNPSAWVARTALNAHRSWWRRHRETLTPATPATAGRDAPAAAGVLDGRLAGAVRRLPLRQRQVLALRILLDLSTADRQRARRGPEDRDRAPAPRPGLGPPGPSAHHLRWRRAAVNHHHESVGLPADEEPVASRVRLAFADQVSATSLDAVVRRARTRARTRRYLTVASATVVAILAAAALTRGTRNRISSKPSVTERTWRPARYGTGS